MSITKNQIEEIKKETKNIRDIPLQHVFSLVGAKVIQKDKVYCVNGENISIDDGKFYNHYHSKGGQGAIDLVMHLEDLDFKGAVAWLGGNVSPRAAVNSATVKARDNAIELVKKPQPLSAPVEKNWPHIKRYLVETRGLNEADVDKAHERGMVYADKYKNACFRYGNSGVEKRGTYNGSTYHGFFGSKNDGFKIKRSANPDGFIIVESAIDALSFYKLTNSKEFEDEFGKYKNFDIISDAGTCPDVVIEISKKYKDNASKIIAFDRDMPDRKGKIKGDAAFKTIAEMIPGVERLTPAEGFKDWNDYIKQSAQQNLINNSNNFHENEDHGNENAMK